MKKIITKQIKRDEIIKIISALIEIIEKYWGEEIKGAHGSVSNVDDNKQFNYEVIKTKEIINKLEHEEKSEDFTIGEWDYYLTNFIKSERIQLCHESDIHFEIEDGFMEKIKEKLNEFRIQYYEPKE